MRSVVYDNNDRFKAVLTDMGFKESNVVIYEKVLEVAPQKKIKEMQCG